MKGCQAQNNASVRDRHELEQTLGTKTTDIAIGKGGADYLILASFSGPLHPVSDKQEITILHSSSERFDTEGDILSTHDFSVHMLVTSSIISLAQCSSGLQARVCNCLLHIFTAVRTEQDGTPALAPPAYPDFLQSQFQQQMDTPFLQLFRPEHSESPSSPLSPTLHNQSICTADLSPSQIQNPTTSQHLHCSLLTQTLPPSHGRLPLSHFSTPCLALINNQGSLLKTCLEYVTPLHKNLCNGFPFHSGHKAILIQ